MRVELLPSSIPASDSQFLVTFLVNDEVAVDAGSLGLLCDIRRQQRVKHVCITHEHLDHIASLGIFLENVYEPGPESVELLASQEVLDFLHDDMFNGRVWPDFFALSAPDNSFVIPTAIEPLQPFKRAGLTLTPVPVSHGVDTTGLIVDDGTVTVAFPSDTGPTTLLWQHLAEADRLKAVFLEVSFPNSRRELATLTGHHCTETFAAEIRKLPKDVRWIVVHRKPRYAAEIAEEIAALGLASVEIVRPGEVYEF